MFYKRILTVTLVAAIALFLLALLPVQGEADIYNKVVRLHVLANSNSNEDQAIKLAVRDAILDHTVPLLQDCQTQEDAIARLAEHEEMLCAVAERVLQKEGVDAGVRITLGLESYPTRSYDSFCFPAGEYISMRVELGRAEGENWWCCLFPPLCLGVATVSDEKAEDAFISVGFTPSQYKIITESDQPLYRARFKILELLGHS